MPKMSAKVVMHSKINLQSDTPTDMERDPPKQQFQSTLPNTFLNASNSEQNFRNRKVTPRVAQVPSALAGKHC